MAETEAAILLREISALQTIIPTSDTPAFGDLERHWRFLHTKSELRNRHLTTAGLQPVTFPLEADLHVEPSGDGEDLP